jgi:hypothetical protein
MGHLSTYLGHFVLTWATKDTLKEQDFPQAHLLYHNFITIFKLSLFVPLWDVLLFYADLDAWVTLGVLELNVVWWVDF